MCEPLASPRCPPQRSLRVLASSGGVPGRLVGSPDVQEIDGEGLIQVIDGQAERPVPRQHEILPRGPFGTSPERVPPPQKACPNPAHLVPSQTR